jgi:hypothetical protein
MDSNNPQVESLGEDANTKETIKYEIPSEVCPFYNNIWLFDSHMVQSNTEIHTNTSTHLFIQPASVTNRVVLKGWYTRSKHMVLVPFNGKFNLNFSTITTRMLGKRPTQMDVFLSLVTIEEQNNFIKKLPQESKKNSDVPFKAVKYETKAIVEVIPGSFEDDDNDTSRNVNMKLTLKPDVNDRSTLVIHAIEFNMDATTYERAIRNVELKFKYKSALSDGGLKRIVDSYKPTFI